MVYAANCDLTILRMSAALKWFIFSWRRRTSSHSLIIGSFLSAMCSSKIYAMCFDTTFEIDVTACSSTISHHPEQPVQPSFNHSSRPFLQELMDCFFHLDYRQRWQLVRFQVPNILNLAVLLPSTNVVSSQSTLLRVIGL